jgi:uncharacterized BrkB/YihY/UPF0761 family membrane protein
MLAYLKVPLTWTEVLRRTFKESVGDDCLGMAAQLAYYFFTLRRMRSRNGSG